MDLKAHILFFSVFVRLINQEGSLLSFAGSCDKDAKVTAAIASSIWAAYEKNGKMAFHNDDLKMIFMDCEVSISHSAESQDSKLRGRYLILSKIFKLIALLLGIIFGKINITLCSFVTDS